MLLFARFFHGLFLSFLMLGSLLLGVGCSQVTGIDLEVHIDEALGIDELRISVRDESGDLVGSDERSNEDGSISTRESIVIRLDSELDGVEVIVQVEGLVDGDVFSVAVGSVLISKGELAELELTLSERVSTMVDILFVVDDSRSMRGNQDNLANDLGVFIDLLLAANDQRIAEDQDPLDFRIAVTSTSVRERLALPDMNINRTTYNPTEGCADGIAYEIESGEPYPAGDFMAPAGNDVILTSDQFLNEQTRADAIRQFQENMRLGVCGSSQEEGLEGMRLAIEKNPDFWRHQSRLVVVFFSDEEDASDMTGEFFNMVYDPEDPHAQDGLIYARSHPDYRDQLTPVSEYKAFLDAEAANRGGTVAIAAIVSAVGEPPHDMEAEVWPDPEQYNCFDPVCAMAACQQEAECDPNNEQDLRGDRIVGSPHWCGGDSPGERYLELARMYPRDDHIMDSICQTDFSSTLLNLVRIAD